MHDDTTRVSDVPTRVSDVHDRPVARMGRRRFLDVLESVGFGALSASLLTAEDVAAAGDDEVPVVYGLARDGTQHAEQDVATEQDPASALRPRTTTVPADWYDDFRGAVAAHRQLDTAGTEGVASSAVIPGEFGGRNAAIAVEVTSESARGAIPESVERVPVEVRRVESATRQRQDDPPMGGRSSDHDVPGGVAVTTGGRYGTLAPAMHDPDSGGTYFATANHLVGGEGNRGVGLSLLGSTRDLASVRESYPREDVLRARPSDGFTPTRAILNPRGSDATPLDVRGQLSKTGLAALKADDEPLEKVGARTGHTTGQIQAVDGFTCAYGAICKPGQLKWGDESAFDDGDSGSVNYHADPEAPEEGVLVGGFNNARTWWPGENYVWGTAAHHVTSTLGFTF